MNDFGFHYRDGWWFSRNQDRSISIIQTEIDGSNPELRLTIDDASWRAINKSLERPFCSDHVASITDRMVCGVCGIHINELRDEPEEAP